MGERSVIARAMWELHGLGWRLDWVDDWPRGWREYGLRRQGTSGPPIMFTAPPKGWDRG